MKVVEERREEGRKAAAKAAPENSNDGVSAPETLPSIRKSASAESDEAAMKQQTFIESNGAAKQDAQQASAAAKQDSQQAQDAFMPKSPYLEAFSVATSASDSSKTAAMSTSDRTRKNLGGSLPDSQLSGTETNAFTQLVKGWETFMKDQQQSDPFANMKQHMLHGLAHVQGAHRLDQGYQIQHLQSQKSGKESSLLYPMASPAFRHTQSTPSRHTIASQYLPSILQMKPADNNAQEDDVPPPPIALDPFQRSTSTPSAFRQHSNYSAFGTADNSAFTHPLQRSAFSGIPTTSTSSEPGAATVSSSAFGPAQFYSMALEDMERTSIEVEMEDTSSSRSKTEGSSEVGSKRGAASRAARFLSDVRVLRRRRKSRNRDGRENPAQPPSVESSASKEADDVASNSPPMIDTAVTVITEPHFNPNDASMLSASSEVSAIVRNQTADSDTAATDCEETSESTVVAPPLEQPDRRTEEMKEDEYHELDSDVEEANYQRIETQLEPSSPSAMSASFQNIADERPATSSAKSTGSAVSTTSKMKVKVSSSNKPRFSLAESPSPTGMERGDGSSLTPRSVASSRSSVTGSSSGHTTQATNNSSGTSTGRQSGLSTISETDREVMETNKEAKRRHLDSLLTTIAKKSENDGTSTNSGSSNSTNPHRYFALAGSPENMREGANVPVAQLLATSSPSTRSPSPVSGIQVGGGQLGRSHTIGTSTITSRRSLNTTSPSATSGSISAARTSSSGSSSEQPPKFVSYVDEEAAVLRGEFIEDSSQRASGSDGEEREASPAAQMLGYSDLSFEEPLAPSQVRSSRLFRGSRRRPPRSPGKGSRMLKTPPPRGSISPLYHHQLSPPRDIVDHPDSSNVSRPYVMRSGLPLRNPVLVTSRSDLGPTTTAPLLENEEVLLIKGRTYRENSIEIMNTDVADANVVTPEKYTFQK